jgi:hypothetical protein
MNITETSNRKTYRELRYRTEAIHAIFANSHNFYQPTATFMLRFQEFYIHLRVSHSFFQYFQHFITSDYTFHLFHTLRTHYVLRKYTPTC